LLLDGPVPAATKQVRLDSFRAGTALHLESVADFFPRAGPHLAGKLLQATFRSSNNVLRAAFLEPLQVGVADHTAIENPNAALLAIACLHAFDDVLDGLAVVLVAGKHLVAERIAFAADDQTDAHLLAVGAVVTRIAALGLRVGCRRAFEVSARDV